MFNREAALRETVPGMVRQAAEALPELQYPDDLPVIETAMLSGLRFGFGPDQLEFLPNAHGARVYGFQRNRQHYMGVCRTAVYPGVRLLRTCLLVQTTGQFGGQWLIITYIGAVYIRHDGESITSFAGLRRLDLLEAVIQSALEG